MKDTILIIDDHEATREALYMILEDNFIVLLAATAHEGLNKLSEDICLIFLDVILPDIYGLEVLRKIKNEYSSIPIIIITAYSTEEVCINAFRIGARDYIVKPFNPKEIIDKAKVLTSTISSQRRRPIPLSSKYFTDNYYLGISEQILNGILQVKDYIDKNYSSPLNLSNASKMAGMNTTYFCKYFKLITGSTFKVYLNNKRLNIAKEILKNKYLKVNHVAEMVGYPSKYFSDAFKKAHGTSPKNLKS